MDITNLGVFSDIYAVWEAYPAGGKEGDYLFIGADEETGVKYRWNKYDQMWQNAVDVTETPARKVETFDGDVDIQNNLHVAGHLRVDGKIKDVYRKNETYSKEQLNHLITTPEVEYVVVNTYGSLPTTGDANTIYRVSKYDGTSVTANAYSEYAWDGTQYVLLDVKDYGFDTIPTPGSSKLMTSDKIADTLSRLSGLFVNGSYISKSGSETASANYSCTPYLKIHEGEDYEAQLYYGTQYVAACYVYDEAQTPLGEFTLPSTPQESSAFTTSIICDDILTDYPTACYVRLSGSKVDYTTSSCPYIIYPYIKELLSGVKDATNVYTYLASAVSLEDVVNMIPPSMYSKIKFIVFRDESGDIRCFQYAGYENGFTNTDFEDKECRWYEVPKERDSITYLTKWSDSSISETDVSLSQAMLAQVPHQYRRAAKVVAYRTRKDGVNGAEVAILKTNAWDSGFTNPNNWDILLSKREHNKNLSDLEKGKVPETKDIVSLEQTLYKDGFLLTRNNGNMFNYRSAFPVAMRVTGTSGNYSAVVPTSSPWGFMFLVTDELDVTKTYVWNRFDGNDLTSWVTEITMLSCEGAVADGTAVAKGEYNSGFYRGNISPTKYAEDSTHLYLYFGLKSAAGNINEAIAKVTEILATISIKSQTPGPIDYFTEYVDYYKPIGSSVSYLPSDSGKTLKVDANGNVVPQMVTTSTLGALPANMGSDNAGKVLYVDTNGAVIPGTSTPSGVVTGAVQYHGSQTLYVGNNLLSGVEVTLGAGWSGNMQSGFTHTSGSTNPLIINYATTSGKKYLVELTLGSPSEGKVFVTLGDIVPVDTYFGTSSSKIGFVSEGGALKIIPASAYASTVSAITLKEIVEQGQHSETIVVTAVNVNHGQMVGNLTGRWNVGIGAENTMMNLQNGSRNIAVGYSTLKEFVEGTRNVGIGTFALSAMTSGDHNVAIGSDSLWKVTTATDNVAVGYASFWQQNITTAARNVAIGAKTLIGAETSSQDNIAIGYGAASGVSVTEPKENVAIGTDSGRGAKEDCVAIGYKAGYNSSGRKNAIAIGANTSVTKDNQCVIGNASVSEFVLGNVATINASGLVLGDVATINASGLVLGDVATIDSNGLTIGNKKIVFNNDNSVTWEEVQD